MQFYKTKRFNKQFKKFDKKIQTAFAKRLKIFVKDQYSPVLHNHKLAGKYKNYCSINITGDVRLIFELEGDICWLVEIGTHSELYGK